MAAELDGLEPMTERERKETLDRIEEALRVAEFSEEERAFLRGVEWGMNADDNMDPVDFVNERRRNKWEGWE